MRLKADEISHEQGGNWRINSDNAKSMRELIKRMNSYFEEEKSFHHETTLSDSVHGFERRLEQA
ncbi:hypothetical protein [Enterococcus sp. AZ103]|uniref:hypothetical protein n=1 Tax=Enterococcus sp. AZ103 TaxID=2774628 RepID=UPI003F682406